METKQIEALPHQLATLQALQEFKNVAMIGGVGSGKTFTLALFLLTEVKRAMEQGDTSTGIITAMSYGQLRRSVLTEVFKCMTEWGIDFQYNQQQSLLTLGGIKKFFCVSAEKGSVDRVRGINAGSIAIDEGCYISQARTAGQVYYCFTREHNLKDCSNPGYGFIACDFNVDPLTAVIGYQSNGVFYIFDEVYMTGGSDTYMLAAELKRRGYGGWRIVADSTYSNRSTSGKSNKVILQNAGFDCLPVRNPLVIDRVQNTNRLLAQKRVIISPSCKKLQRDLEQVVWRPNGSLDQVTNRELTHISDALGYALHKFAPIQSRNEVGIISQER